jgi:SAM-dependent methyltransferase
MHETDPTKRFSNRVDDYVKYRPGYPDQLIPFLTDELGLHESDVVADIGSGTGLLTRLLLDIGNRVFGVEPNEEMRRAAESLLRARGRFVSVDGSAEATTLADDSVDVVVAAQAFHWFDRNAARHEFERILRPGGWVAVLWNSRRVDSNPFMREYERLLVERGVDYDRVDFRHIDASELERFFGEVKERSLPFEESLDFDTSLGRMLSASYVAAPGQEGHDEIVQGLREAFDRHQEGGRVRWAYNTDVYSGRIT